VKKKESRQKKAGGKRDAAASSFCKKTRKTILWFGLGRGRQYHIGIIFVMTNGYRRLLLLS